MAMRTPKARPDIQKLQAEICHLDKRKAQRKEQDNKDSDRRKVVRMGIHRIGLQSVIGIPNAVEYLTPPFGLPHPDFRGNLGTITEVRRTRCSVDFQGEAWTFPIINIYVAGDAVDAVDVFLKATLKKVASSPTSNGGVAQ